MRNTRLHIRAFKSEFEMSCLLSLLTVVADIIWLIHDSYCAGISSAYVMIGCLLTTGAYGIIRMLIKHHKRSIKRVSK